MSTAIPLERKHIPPIPAYLKILRITQFILAIILLGLSAYAVSVNSRLAGASLTLFTVTSCLLFP
jgi:hypothetical protein